VPGRSFPVETDFDFCLKTALGLGHELSLHGYKHTKNEFGYLSVRTLSIPLSIVPLPTFDEQRKNIEQAVKVFTRLTGVRPSGFRAPFYLYNKETLRALSNLNFKYDSSETVFKPAHGDHLRVRWLHDCKPHSLYGLLEIPVTGDYTYDLNNINFCKSLKRAVRDFEWIMSRHGVFVVNIHPNVSEMNLLGKFLQILCKELDGRTEFIRLVDIWHSEL
jgi:peptidoglycan/xylan/chitin deacetylase (PgdA/CDA1 family)